MGDILVNGVSFLALVFGLVEFSKKLELTGRVLTVTSLMIGLVLGVCYQIAQLYPVFGQWFGVVVFGLAVGLAASGIYDFVNARFPAAK